MYILIAFGKIGYKSNGGALSSSIVYGVAHDVRSRTVAPQGSEEHAGPNIGPLTIVVSLWRVLDLLT